MDILWENYSSTNIPRCDHWQGNNPQQKEQLGSMDLVRVWKWVHSPSAVATPWRNYKLRKHWLCHYGMMTCQKKKDFRKKNLCRARVYIFFGGILKIVLCHWHLKFLISPLVFASVSCFSFDKLKQSVSRWALCLFIVY